MSEPEADTVGRVVLWLRIMSSNMLHVNLIIVSVEFTITEWTSPAFGFA